ncbi:MAG: MucR family transcriptional regulator [Pseudonocardiaceae bacterium]
MTSTAATPVNSSWRAHSRTHAGHAHLWSLPDGTGLHAPRGELVIESGTGRVCCHLCGRWYVSLGSHLRTHGHTADSYRDAMGLCRSRPLVAETLSRSIATRQSEAYRRSPELRAQLAVGQEFSKTGRLATLARTTRTASASPESARIRHAALAAGRVTRAAQRDRALARRLRELGFDDLAGYLRHAYSAGASLRSLAKVTGLGWARLRREIDAAGVTVRPASTGGDRRSCVETATAR